MLIVLLDDSQLHVFESAHDAESSIEPIDAENEIRAAFDEAGVPYKVEWIEENKRTKLIGKLESIQQGAYRMVPAGESRPKALADLLEQLECKCDPVEQGPVLEKLLVDLRSRS